MDPWIFPALNFVLLIILMTLLGVHFSSYRIASWMDSRVDVVRRVLRGKRITEFEVQISATAMRAILPDSEQFQSVRVRMEGEIVGNAVRVENVKAIQFLFTNIPGDANKTEQESPTNAS